MKSQDKKVQEHITKPRLEAGPIIVCFDTSSSMNGKPGRLALTLLIQLLRMAKKKKRKCFMITFSVRTKTIELTSPSNWRRLDHFLERGFSGGTNGEEMLHTAIATLHKKDFSLADVLIISDFEFPLPVPKTKAKMKVEHDKGTRFYGLQIGDRSYYNYESILDKIWKVTL